MIKIRILIILLVAEIGLSSCTNSNKICSATFNYADSVSLPVYTRIAVKRNYIDKHILVDYTEKSRYFDPDTLKSHDTFFVKGTTWKYKRDGKFYPYFSIKSFNKKQAIQYGEYFEFRPDRIIQYNNQNVYVFKRFRVENGDYYGDIYFNPKFGEVRIEGLPDMDLHMINYKEEKCKLGNK